MLFSHFLPVSRSPEPDSRCARDGDSDDGDSPRARGGCCGLSPSCCGCGDCSCDGRGCDFASSCGDCDGDRFGCDFGFGCDWDCSCGCSSCSAKSNCNRCRSPQAGCSVEAAGCGVRPRGDPCHARALRACIPIYAITQRHREYLPLGKQR